MYSSVVLVFRGSFAHFHQQTLQGICRRTVSAQAQADRACGSFSVQRQANQRAMLNIGLHNASWREPYSIRLRDKTTAKGHINRFN